eukprot:8889661-Lingulodinium_polyedra.AAC.1
MRNIVSFLPRRVESAAAAARGTLARSMRAPVFWRVRGARERAAREPLRRQNVDSTASLCSVRNTLRNAAVES